MLELSDCIKELFDSVRVLSIWHVEVSDSNRELDVIENGKLEGQINRNPNI